MVVNLKAKERYSQEARNAGREWHASVAGLKVFGEVAQSREGWLPLGRPFTLAADQDPLSVHADWAGPAKLIALTDHIEQRVEFYVGRKMDADDCSMIDEEASQEMQALFNELRACAWAYDGQPMAAGWQPPAAEMLSAWLTPAGYEVAIDKEQNLRLTLKRQGCDGQVRIERREGRLRFVLPLGRWDGLEATAEKAMQRLASEANARSRLVRIAWLVDGTARRCEAQVDLSGLPAVGDGQPVRQKFWREMVCMAVRGLELALRQLGLEMPALAEPRNRDLAELVSQYS